MLVAMSISLRTSRNLQLVFCRVQWLFLIEHSPHKRSSNFKGQLNAIYAIIRYQSKVFTYLLANTVNNKI